MLKSSDSVDHTQGVPSDPRVASVLRLLSPASGSFVIDRSVWFCQYHGARRSDNLVPNKIPGFKIRGSSAARTGR